MDQGGPAPDPVFSVAEPEQHRQSLAHISGLTHRTKRVIGVFNQCIGDDDAGVVDLTLCRLYFALECVFDLLTNPKTMSMRPFANPQWRLNDAEAAFLKHRSSAY